MKRLALVALVGAALAALWEARPPPSPSTVTLAASSSDEPSTPASAAWSMVASNRVAAVAPPSYDGPYRPPVSNNAVPGDPRIQGLTPEEARKLVALWHHDDSERYQRRRRQVKQWHATHPHTPPPRADEL